MGRVWSVGLFSLAAMVLQVPASARATEAEEQQKELERVREQIESARKSRHDLESRKADLQDQLANIERTYGQVAKALKGLEEQEQSQLRQIAELQHQRKQLGVSMRKQRQMLEGQARAVYAAGRQDWLKLVLNQEDPSRLSRILAYYSYLNRARASLLQSMGGELASARRLQDELFAESERLNETRRAVAREQAELEKSRQDRRKLLASLERDIQTREVDLKQLQANEQRLEDLLAAIRRRMDETRPSETVETTGPPPAPQSRCPVTGRLLGRFGSPRMSGRWDGMLIAAAEGTPVHAVASGDIAYAEWLSGYGLLTIVDHGDGYMSLYAFNQSLYKRVGDRVNAGDVIATVGTSGGRTESALYFGIREKGRPVDPAAWCNLSN